MGFNSGFKGLIEQVLSGCCLTSTHKTSTRNITSVIQTYPMSLFDTIIDSLVADSGVKTLLWQIYNGLHSILASWLHWNQVKIPSLSSHLPSPPINTPSFTTPFLGHYTRSTAFLFWLQKQVLQRIYSQRSKVTCLNNRWMW